MLYFFVFLNQDNILLWFVRPRQLLLDRIELINLIVKTRVEVLEREMLWEHKRISSFPKLQMLLTVLGLFLKYLLHIYLTQKFEKAKCFGKLVKTV